MAFLDETGLAHLWNKIKSTFALASHSHTKLDNTNLAYGTCATAAGTAAKVVTITGNDNWSLKTGAIVAVKFSYTNTASSVTLNVNGSGAKNIWYNNAKYTSTSSQMTGYANRTIFYIYDGTYWVWLGGSYTDGNTVPSAYCTTAAATAAKTATCTNYYLLAKSYIQVIVSTTNTYAGALTLNINGKGAKPIYINGSASSSSNYALTRGSYLVYYDGTNYYFRTDGKITGDITGTAAKATKDGDGNIITDTYAPIEYGIPLIIGTQTASTNAFTGVAPFSTLKHGQTIRYWLPYAGTSSGDTLNLTLSGGGTTGAKQIYYKGTTKLTTHFSAGSLIILTYLENANVNGTNYTGWWADSDYYSNTTNSCGSDNTSSKIFLCGRTTQSNTGGTSYSHDTVYVGSDGHVYSNSKQVVNLNDTQALTNKTYNGYTLGSACAQGVDTAVKEGSSNLITSGAVHTALQTVGGSGDVYTKVTVTFDGLGWSSQGDGSYTQVLTVSGVTASNNILVAPTAAYVDTYNDMGCYAIAQAEGTLTFKCYDPQDVAVEVEVIIF